MRTPHEFWFHPTPEDDAVRRRALDAVARAQSSEFTAWREFCDWDLGPGGAGFSRFLFDTVGVVLRSVYPLIAQALGSGPAGLLEFAPWGENGLFDKVTAERRRQIGLGHDAEHDDDHIGEQLAKAAACYALPGWALIPSRKSNSVGDRVPYDWPWEADSWKPSHDDRKRHIVKAMALLAAEHERLERKESRES